MIGNGKYAGGFSSLSNLANPENDANDIAAVLELLGFSVDTVINSNMAQMDEAVLRLHEKLSLDKNSYGFFFYAGHGVQSGGENFLIPVNATIPNEFYLRDRAISVQSILDNMNDAGNSLNVVVLDACRDNPFGWSRGGIRGLQVVNNQPADSIIVYATGAGKTAADGEGRNGLFTGQLLANLATPGIEVSEVFRRTGADVSTASGRKQIPAVYNQFFGTAYLGTAPEDLADTDELQKPIILQPTVISRRLPDDRETRLWSVGASAGTTFARPWLIGMVQGTVAPFNYALIQIGFDVGFLSGDADVGYYSLSPFAHFAFFMPFSRYSTGMRGGWYAGAGTAYTRAEYRFPSGNTADNVFTANVIAGANILNFLDISYTLRTDFKGVSHKLAVGYVYRFK